MRSFTQGEVKDMFSHDHRLNTAVALSKPYGELTADDLLEHWKRFHPFTIVVFDVTEEPSLFDGR